MAALTEKQEHYIKTHLNDASIPDLAHRLKANETAVADYVQSLRQPRGRKKERAFRTATVLLPFILFGLLELLLRLFNYGPNLDIFTTFLNDSKYWVTNASVGRRYFFVKEVSPAISYDAILKQKPDNGYRIFVLGGSTTAGFPYYHNGAFSRMLATRLEDVFPDRHIEVLNLAMPAVNSYAVLDLVDELVDYEPDAFLIYAGHNEFYGALGIASTEALGRYRSVVNLYLKFQHSKVFFLFRNFLGWLKLKITVGGDSPVPKNATLMERMVGRKQVAYGSETYRIARDIFRDNLSDILEIAHKHGVPVLLSDLVSNVHDQAPFESVFKEGLDEQRWHEHFDAGKQLFEAGEFEQALTAFEKAGELDDGVAVLSYQTARCLEKLGRLHEAKTMYYKAKDQDALRFRASEEFNQTIWEVAARWDVPVVDMEAAFASESPDSLIGKNLMLEHLHPNVDGYFLMGRAFFDAMRRNGFVAAEWDSTRIGDEQAYRRRMAVTPLDLEIAKIKMDVLKSGWPFKRGVTPNFARDYKPKNKVQEMAFAVFKDEKTWEVGHVELAEYYAKHRQLQEAAAEYRALVRGTPYNVSPYLRLGLIYLELQENAEALAIFEKSMKLEETAMANKWIGSLHVNAGNPQKGLPYLQRALLLQKNDPEAMYNATVALAMMGEFQQARTMCQELLAQQPDHPGVRKLWNRLKDK